jgi:hypothetical protein
MLHGPAANRNASLRGGGACVRRGRTMPATAAARRSAYRQREQDGTGFVK